MVNTIPELDHFSGSWIVICRETGKAVLETFNQQIAKAIYQDKYEVMTAYQYLVNLNKN